MDGYFISGAECLECDSTCLTCNGALSSNCLTCPSGTYFISLNSSCVPCNVNGYFISSTECLQCHSTCLTCNGALSTNCLSCPGGTYLLSSNNSCVSCNEDHYFISDTQCLQCHSTCLTCSGVSSTSCITCVASSYFVTSNNSCVACNGNNYFISGADCLECHSSCLTCNGELATECITCVASKYFVSSNNSCVDCSVDGYFISGSQCLRCDSTCLTCNGPLSTNCLSCPSGTYLLSSNNSCVSCNVDGYFTSGTLCLECHPTCLACNGELPTGCITCAVSTYLSSHNSCVRCNGEGFFVSGTQCLECDPTCLTCNGASPSSCLSCKTGRYLQNSTCLLLDNEFISTAGDMAGITSQMQYVASTVMPVMLVERSTSAMILVGFLAEVGLYKYLNVPFPENFVSFCEQMESLGFPNIFRNMDSVNGGNNPNSIIGKFKFWEMSATLLDNSSFAIAKELITLAIIFGLNIFVFLLKGSPKISDVLRKVRTLFMWNVFLSNYLGDYPELLLNSMIQLRENYVSSAYANFSFALAVIIVSSYALLGMYFRYILNKRLPLTQQLQEKRHSKSLAIKRSTQKWAKVPDSLEILVEDFHEKSRFARNFILLMLLETFLQILMIFFFQENGLAQSMLYMIIVLAFFSLSAWKRPYKSNIQTMILLLNQGSKLAMGIIAAIFGINEMFRFLSSDLINLMGFILILLILIVMGLNLVVSFLLVIHSFYERIKEWRSKLKKEHSNVQAKNRKTYLKKNNFLEEPSPSKIEESSFELHRDSNEQVRQPRILVPERRLRPVLQSMQSLHVKKVHRSKRNNRVFQFNNNSISETEHIH